MKKRYFNIMAVSLVVVFYVAIFYLIWTSISNFGSDRSNMRFDFEQPPRIIYIANVDTELDFTGATLVARALDGGFSGEPFPLELIDNQIVIEHAVGVSRQITVEHSIDFTKPGVYVVELIYDLGATQFPIPFFVQVVDEETFNQLKEGAR